MVATKAADEYLSQALEALKRDQEEWEARKEREHHDFMTRINAIESIMQGHDTVYDRPAAQVTAPVPTPVVNPEGPILSIGDDKLNKMREFLRRNSQARQADIASELGLNSGTVSVGLRRLQLDGLVRSGGRRNGSRVWEFINVPAEV